MIGRKYPCIAYAQQRNNEGDCLKTSPRMFDIIATGVSWVHRVKTRHHRVPARAVIEHWQRLLNDTVDQDTVEVRRERGSSNSSSSIPHRAVPQPEPPPHRIIEGILFKPLCMDLVLMVARHHKHKVSARDSKGQVHHGNRTVQKSDSDGLCKIRRVTAT
jgi:hypothetical protein